MDSYVFDANSRTFVISKGASLGYASIPGLSETLPYFNTVSVTAGDFCTSVTHNIGIDSLGILASVNWPTIAWINAQTAISFQICFTAPAPASAKLSWEVSDIMPIDAVTVAAVSHPITHNRGDATVELFFMPNWPTMVWDSTADRTADAALVFFSQPAPAGAQLTWRPAG
jgi:hypothetical protein